MEIYVISCIDMPEKHVSTSLAPVLAPRRGTFKMRSGFGCYSSSAGDLGGVYGRGGERINSGSPSPMGEGAGG